MTVKIRKKPLFRFKVGCRKVVNMCFVYSIEFFPSHETIKLISNPITGVDPALQANALNFDSEKS